MGVERGGEPETAIGPTKVLIVDDDADNLVYMCRVLGQTYEVDTADSGEHALETMERQAYAVIISDQRMPGMTGSEFLAESIKRAPDAIRIIVTAYSDLDVTVSAINEAKISAYLHKPFTTKQIRSAVDTALKLRRATIENSTLVRRLEEANLLLSMDLDERTKEIQRSEARFRALMQSLPLAVGVVANDALGFVNAAFVAYLGHTTEAEILDRPIEGFLDPEQRPEFAEAARAVLAGGKPMVLADQRFLGKDKLRPVGEVALLATTLDGERCLLVVIRDLTEFKEAQARLMHADRMTSVGMLAAGIAHEINNPLTYVIANLGFLLAEWPRIIRDVRRLGRDAPGDGQDPPQAGLLVTLEQQLALVEEAQSGAERVRTIVRDLKSFARPEEREIAADVGEVLASAINMAWNEIKHRAQLVKDLRPVPRVHANETRLAQVFLNLLINAAHAIPEGDVARNTISVSTGTLRDGRVRIEVRDTGVGILPEHRAHIFDPFFTTKTGTGTGLGLFLCHGIVTKLGGQIEVDSQPGQGATFRVILPAGQLCAAAAGAAHGTAEPKPEPGPAPRRARVLIVDDEPGVARAMKRMLAGHDVVVSKDGADALELLEADRGFDVIFCDLLMPNLTGMDLFREASARGLGIADRFVFVTGNAFTPRAREFLSQVPNPRLDKPVDAQTLLDMVRLACTGPGRVV
jgi:PAS domain S-box-containing protein